jgi:two-component system cell cycle response regulator
VTEIELERNLVLTQLAGAVAHKLKQPLSVAWGYVELLLEAPRTDLDATTLHYLHEIDQALRSMDHVVNMLQVAKVAHTRQYAGSFELLDLDEQLAISN